MSLVKDMNMTKFITNLIAFNPPNPASYDIETVTSSEKNTKNYSKIKFTHSEFSEVFYPWIETECYELFKKINTKSKKVKKIILLHIKNKSAKNKLTFIFSHGNACDLGNIYPFLIDFASQMKVYNYLI
jgi:hypothetical protein